MSDGILYGTDVGLKVKAINIKFPAFLVRKKSVLWTCERSTQDGETKGTKLFTANQETKNNKS